MSAVKAKISLEAINAYHRQLKPFLERALDDVSWSLSTFMQKADDDAKRIYSSAKVLHRVKPEYSLWRKCLRDGVSDPNAIPDAIEDVLGLRIITPNKNQARDLFDSLRRKKNAWFCEIASEPKFTPYTISDKNGYSLVSGYQAYHVTFVFKHSYAPFTTVDKWPTEIQITSQLWQFWADYSHAYFYRGSGAMVDKLLPYNVTIAKMFDNAEDLMGATASILSEASEAGPRSDETPKINDEGPTNSADVEEWLSRNWQGFFGPPVRIPNALILSKIADELNLYGISLDKLSEILQDSRISSVYTKVLAQSLVPNIPVYQHIIFFLLLAVGNDLKSVIERVNKELALLGIKLTAPLGEYSERS